MWDYDGMKIFQGIKQKIPQIQPLFPGGEPRSIEQTEHKSHWKQADQWSGLDQKFFATHEQKLIESLIKRNQWIVEESNDLIEMLKQM